ncbi:MAG: phosphatidate cytidylyltransferase [Oscillospiraceae bacterium]|nr:phosphatidate cytidylyltransferase [Oscillospiraceae bacterium]
MMVTRIVVSLVLAPLFLAVLLFAPMGIVAFMVSGIVSIAAFELMRAVGVEKNRFVCGPVLVAAALIPQCYWLQVDAWAVKLILLCLLFALFLDAVLTYETEKAVRAEHILFGLFGGVLYPMLMSSLVQLRMLRAGGRDPYGAFFVLLPIVAAFLTDTGAYFFGMFLGKHRGILPVSPKKSVEGFVGGLVSGVGFMTLYGVILNHFFALDANLIIMAFYGLVGAIVTMLGDLSFSLIKRQFGIKDYGSLLPGHGGMLDRFDSMSFAAPIMWLLVTLFPAF